MSSSAISVVRSMEHDALRHLPPRTSADLDTAYTRIVLSRTLYAQIEPPPTRHQSFIIQTFWTHGHIPRDHGVFVTRQRTLRQVRANRPGLFGEEI